MEHAAGRALRPIIKALFGELTVLGFLSATTLCLQWAHAFYFLSRIISDGYRDGGTQAEDGGENEEADEVYELVESIHFGMFGVMVIFLISVLIEVYYGLHSQKEWCQWDRACHDESYVNKLLQNNAILDEEFDAITSMQGLHGTVKRAWRYFLPYLRFLPFLRDKRKEGLEDKMEFCSLRIEFFKERMSIPPFAPAGEVEGGPSKNIGPHFNFGRYLTFVYAKKMATVVEIDVTTWLFFAGGVVCYFMLFGFLGFSVKALAWAWVLIGWIFHALSINFEKYLLAIRDRFSSPEFVPQPRLRELSWGSWSSFTTSDDLSIPESAGEREPLRRTTENSLQYQLKTPVENLPMWCYIDLDELDRRRSRLAKYLFGPTPNNRQEALYLFGHDVVPHINSSSHAGI